MKFITFTRCYFYYMKLILYRLQHSERIFNIEYPTLRASGKCAKNFAKLKDIPINQAHRIIQNSVNDFVFEIELQRERNRNSRNGRRTTMTTRITDVEPITTSSNYWTYTSHRTNDVVSSASNVKKRQNLYAKSFKSGE